MTYCAVLTLYVLDPDHGWDRLPSKQQMVQHIRSLQRSDDGSFGCIIDPSEHDLRFLYCACVLSYVLQDWSTMDIDLAVNYIQSCKGYDGGIGLVPGQEGHGGSTFCGLASLILMGRSLEEVEEDNDSKKQKESNWKQELIHWCVHRQTSMGGGMQGRPNKLQDTCYSYWIGASLRLLDYQDELLDHDALQQFILSCQAPSNIGGFSKVPGGYPDVLHSFYSLAWLSISNERDNALPLYRFNATLGIRQDRVDELRKQKNIEQPTKLP